MRLLAPLVLAPVLALALSSATATDLGRIGPTYPIGEPHLLDDIQRRLQEKERRGELKQLEEAARARGVKAVTDPAPVPGLQATTAARTFYYDPTLVLDRNILDDQGRVLFPAETRKNPLEIVALSKRLLFFDARDPRQVQQARRLIEAHGGRVKPILVGGSYLDLMKAWRVRVYYDQNGTLTRQLGIAQVPALVSQEGLRLRIDELVL
jgi:conjugal transfer pilus assembly protein TraW